MLIFLFTGKIHRTDPGKMLTGKMAETPMMLHFLHRVELTSGVFKGTGWIRCELNRFS